MAYTNEALGKALEDLTIAYNNFLKGFVQSAIDTMTNTVIANINQEAKDYIAGQLATQKAELEQAIENAKIALDNQKTQAVAEVNSAGKTKQQELANLIAVAEQSLNDKINTAEQSVNNTITLATNNLNEKVTNAKNELDLKVSEVSTEIDNNVNSILNQVKQLQKDYWIKFFQNKMYIQRWGDADPSTIWSFEGYRWTEVDRQGVFDRPRGNGAPFKATINGVETNLTGGGSSEFNGAIHGDRIRNILGQLGWVLGTPSGAFKGESWSSAIDSGPYWNPHRNCDFKPSRVVPTGNENTPIYRTAIYWKLEKI